MSAPSNSSDSKVCRYFAAGCCTRGTDCHFIHDRTLRGDNVCQYFSRGSCSYGTACRFDHVRPKNGPKVEVKASSSSTNKKMPTPVQLPKPGLNVAAPEFVPSWKRAPEGTSYALAAGGSTSVAPLMTMAFCPYYEEHGECVNPHCVFLHGDMCEFCNRWCLDPNNELQRQKHSTECVNLHEQAMEEAFVTARSMEKTCGICMENIMAKDLRFGILEGCRHCFCLDCIREWRTKHSTTDLDSKVVRSCPECRQHSNYVIPSVIWIEDDQEKSVMIDMYKENMKTKVCKYYTNNKVAIGCPFGNKCFYKHQLPDGSIDPGEEPHVRRRPRLCEYLFPDVFDDDDAYDDDDDGEGSFFTHEVINILLNRIRSARLDD